MKKLILITAIIIAVITTSFYAQLKQKIYPEKVISKSINLKVFAGSAYRSKIYARCIAKVHFTVTKVKGNESIIILEKEYPELNLEKYPSLTQAIDQTIYIPYVVDSQEQIIISYTITYLSKESILTISNVKFVTKGTSSDQLHITI